MNVSHKRGRMNYEGIIWLHTDIFDRQGTATGDSCHNSEEKFVRLEWRSRRFSFLFFFLDVLKWGKYLRS